MENPARRVPLGSRGLELRLEELKELEDPVIRAQVAHVLRSADSKITELLRSARAASIEL